MASAWQRPFPLQWHPSTIGICFATFSICPIYASAFFPSHIRTLPLVPDSRARASTCSRDVLGGARISFPKFSQTASRHPSSTISKTFPSGDDLSTAIIIPSFGRSLTIPTEIHPLPPNPVGFHPDSLALSAGSAVPSPMGNGSGLK